MIDNPRSLLELRQQLPRMRDLEERAFEPDQEEAEAAAQNTTETIELDELLLMYGSLLSTPEAEVHFENGETIIKLRDAAKEPMVTEENPEDLVLAMTLNSSSDKVNNPFPRPIPNDRSPALPKNITDGLAERNIEYPSTHRITPRRAYHEQPTLGELRSHVEETIDDAQSDTEGVVIETAPEERYFEEVVQAATNQTEVVHEQPRKYRSIPSKLRQILQKSKFVFEVGYGLRESGSRIRRRTIASNRAKYLMTSEEYAAEIEEGRQASIKRSTQKPVSVSVEGSIQFPEVMQQGRGVENIVVFGNTEPMVDKQREDSAAIEPLDFSMPKNTARIRNWTRKRIVSATTATQSLFEKAQRHPAIAVAAVGGVAVASAVVFYKYGITRSSGSSNQVAEVLTNHSTTPTSTIDKATNWYQIYQQHNPNVSRDQFNQIINSVEFKNMCDDPVQFARFMAAS